MKNLVYIGNELKPRLGSPTSVDVLAPLLREEGFEVKTASSKENQLLRLFDMLQLIFSNRKWVEMVLIDTYSTRNFWYAYYCAKLCQVLKLTYIPVLHGGDLPTRLKNNPKISKSLFEGSKVNVAPSKYLFEIFQQAGFKNLKFIPNSIFLDNYPFKTRRVLKPKLLWVRAFSEIYNPMLAIKVLENLLQDYPDAELCMVGAEKDKSFKQGVDYSKKNKLPVTFTGRLKKAEWIALSAEYDIFFNTTNIDNTPVSVIEAMALGLPIVSTNVGGIPYLLQNRKTGLLVRPGDEAAMLSAVNTLLKDPDLAERLSVNARFQSEKFDWGIVKREWFSI